MGRLPVAEAVAYAIEIGRALSAAHAQRLVHRDVKPQNVLIDARGPREGHRLRHRPLAGGAGPDRHRPRARHHRLRLAGAGAGQGGDRAVRRLLARDRAVRDAHGRGPVQGREPGGGGHEAREGPPARRAAAAAGGVGLAGRGGRARHGQGDRATAMPRRPRWWTTSRSVLAIEVARSGETSGEATTVLRALSGDTADFVPVRLRNPRRWVLTVRGGAAAGRRRGRLLRHPHREGRGRHGGAAGGGADRRSTWPPSAVEDYDPEGDDSESDDATQQRHRRQPLHRVGHRALHQRPRRRRTRTAWASTWTPARRSRPGA